MNCYNLRLIQVGQLETIRIQTYEPVRSSSPSTTPSADYGTSPRPRASSWPASTSGTPSRCSNSPTCRTWTSRAERWGLGAGKTRWSRRPWWYSSARGQTCSRGAGGPWTCGWRSRSRCRGSTGTRQRRTCKKRHSSDSTMKHSESSVNWTAQKIKQKHR